ncbi:type 2 lanthipeptide synthetase LanM family protein [Staphylococcus hominis]|uniref:type 2 lanthipeptide synthetase LanM family protein n=1 Tax=Staphylococcus hominis TaxID=1290 RepID=UPI003D06C9DF
MIKNLYNSFTISERKKINILEKKTKPINEAYIYWEKLLHNKLEETIDYVFSINKDFIEKNYSSKTEKLYESNFGWIKNFKRINFLGSYKLRDEELYQDMPFFPFFKPFLNYYRKNIEEILSVEEKKYLSKECKLNLERQLLELLLKISHKTLILEINYNSKQKKLSGDNEKDRYLSFCQKLEKDYFLKKSLIEEYPVLFRLLTQKTESYIKNLKSIVYNFYKDKEEINNTLNYKISKETKIINITMDNGDTHNNKSVSILTFNNVDKLIFKPRSMQIDKEYNDFINWLNNKNENIIPIRTAKILEKENYGWSENIKFEYCNNKKDIKNFYTVLGEHLAVLHIFNTTDIHYENIISSKNKPVLIDIETLFHHTLITDEISISPVLSKAADLLNSSVLSTGILPLTTKGFDLSGTGNTENKTIPFKIDKLKNSYTDNIKIEKTLNTIMKPGENYPKIKNKTINASDYVPHIVTGFKNTYQFFLNNKKVTEIRLNKFKNLNVRKIFRNTQQYSSLLNLSYHPDFLRNQIDRDFLFARLYQISRNDNSLTSLIPYEIEQLNEGNIPFFSTLTNSKDLYTNSGKITNYFKSHGHEESLKKLKSLSLADYYFQIKIIQGSLLGIDLKKDINISNLNESSSTLLEKVENIADLLINTSIQTENEMCWISMAVMGEDEENIAFSITGHGLYDGNPGICLLFTYLYKLTKKNKYKEVAYKSLEPIKASLKDIYNEKNFSIGPFMGLSGYIYVCDHMSYVFSDDSLLEESIFYSKILTNFIKQDKLLDIIGGSSGALMVVINLYKRTKLPSLLETINTLTEHILSNINYNNEDIYWPIITSGKSYIGFSHGTAGIISSLSFYYAYIHQDERILNIIKRGIRTENKQYNENTCNWFSDHTNGYTITWCHGASGILLSRCLIKNNIINKINVNNDISHAFKALSSRNFTNNYSLCHGELGNLDILLYIKENINEYDKKEEIIKEIEKSTLNIQKNINKIRGDVNTIGLMGGITGLAYGLLRIIDPKKIPSVNSLEGIK